MTRSIVNLKANVMPEKLMRAFLCIFVVFAIIFLTPSLAQAKLQSVKGEDGTLFTRSLESLRDLDYQTWELIAYRKGSFEGKFVLRIVGYSGTLRMDHPNRLIVHSGLRDWYLDDITLSNQNLANDSRQAAAEFELNPLLEDLSNNRPLRLRLPGVFADLPVPPYVVNEWRSLTQENFLDEKY